jgi:hypothetical protein
MYINFITKLVDKRMSVCIPFREHDRDELNSTFIHDLLANYREVVFMSHSSGSLDMFNILSKNTMNTTHKMILMDPVKQLHVPIMNLPPCIKSVLFMNSGYSFIPSFLKLLKTHFKYIHACDFTEENEERFGHVDILNPFFSTFITQLGIIQGHKKRDFQYLSDYHDWLSIRIQRFILRK